MSLARGVVRTLKEEGKGAIMLKAVVFGEKGWRSRSKLPEASTIM